MRDAIYRWWSQVPFKIGSGLGWALGLYSAVRPVQLQQIVGQRVSADTIQNAGIALLAASSVYFAVLWLLKPTIAASSSGGVVFTGGTHYHYGDRAQEEAQSIAPPAAQSVYINAEAPGLTVAPPQAEVTVDGASLPPIRGSANITIGEVTMQAQGYLFPLGLYTGNIVASAGRLAESDVLEIAFRIFNGTGIALIVDEVTGEIEIEGQALQSPAFRAEERRIEPFAEFVIVIVQRVPEHIRTSMLQLFEHGGINLNLAKLAIMMRREDAPECRDRVPLWDAIRLWRRDDIFTGRVFSVSITESGSATGTLS